MDRKTMVWLLIAAVLFVTWLVVLGPTAAITLQHVF